MDNVLSDNGFYSTTSWTILPNPAARSPSGRWEAANDRKQWLWIWLRLCGGSLIRLSPKIEIWDDYFRLMTQLVTLFYAEVFAIFCDGPIETSKRQNSWTKQEKNDRFLTRTFPGWWSCRQISRLNLVSSSRRFVVSSFCRFAIETEEPSKFQNFEFKRGRPPSRRWPWRLGRPSWVRNRGSTRQSNMYTAWLDPQ